MTKSKRSAKQIPRVGRVDPVKPAHELQVGRLCPALLLPSNTSLLRFTEVCRSLQKSRKASVLKALRDFSVYGSLRENFCNS